MADKDLRHGAVGGSGSRRGRSANVPAAPSGAPPPAPARPMASMASAPRQAPASPPPAKQKGGILGRLVDGLSKRGESASTQGAPAANAELSMLDSESVQEEALAEAKPADGEEMTALLSRQLASGLWEGTGAGPEPVRQARATALALLELLRQGITSHHPLHGAQVKKAVEALLSLAAGLTGVPEVAELALGVAWLVAGGPRTRGRIVQAAQPLVGLSACLTDEARLRQHVDTLAAR